MGTVICEKCGDEGYTIVNRDGTDFLTYCDCGIKKYNAAILSKIIEKIPALVRKNLSFKQVDGIFKYTNDFKPRPDQESVCAALKNKCWISGETRKGKSHIVAERVISLARVAKKILRIEWMEAKDFDNLIMMQYGENSDKYEYNKMKLRMAELDILILNDFDKIGKDVNKKFSVFKSTEIKDFCDNVFPEIPVFIVTANSTMENFMNTFADQEVAKTIWSRFVSDLTPEEIIFK